MTIPLLSVENLHVTISTRAGEVRAVSGVSFGIARGRTLGLVGESGSGKSMTAMSLIGLAPAGANITVAGRASFDGIDFLAQGEAGLRQLRGRRIGVVFQDPAAALDPLMSIGDQLREALPRGLDGPARAVRVQRLLGEVGLDAVADAEHRFPHELSGGQQQRVVIATALAGDPELIIADEPTTALDMTVQRQILDLLDRLRRTRDLAMLLITHDLGVVARQADDVVVLRHGRMVEAGPTAEVLRRPRTDYSRALIESRPLLSDSVALLPPASPLLEVKALSVSYPGPRLFSPRIMAVRGIDLSVTKGEALGILGESGSGKSTLAKTLVGLLRHEAGRFSFGAAPLDPWRMGRAERARIQYIFQDSYGALNPRMTVAQAVGEPMAIAGLPAGERRKRVAALLEEVGLDEEHRNRLPRELSGGQRQRINIARALAVSPELLICDEIVSALDVTIQAQVLELLRQLQKRRGLSLIFISHDLAVVAGLCQRVVVMKDGEAVETGATRDVFRAPAHAYTRSLIEAALALEHGLPDIAMAMPA
ncbi:MAG TPA: ABC transporter ATP-binding protein [Devosia sp.]|jgi:ABC-type glutathione transport system ATPase component|uniref:ABC transporter ATP-binding protein n=1 Tax=Devosia sp. TaxID=1871048 RepID=UPI002DDD48BD|nr:ABC transporter ATP-binding protein [Devosia sp.]HEV2518322.1 ABC transporter ATP-binding protein [Devosia sp.]